MSGFELNKIAGAFLLASLITMIVGVTVNILYKPNLKPQNRGYSVAVTEDVAAAPAAIKEIKFDIPELMKTANAENGKELAKKCISCHSFEVSGPNKVGPNLANIVGHEKGKKEGFKYSTAMETKGGIWDEESLFPFLHKPSKYIPGTKMSFVGFDKPEDIVNVIAYLNTISNK